LRARYYYPEKASGELLHYGQGHTWMNQQGCGYHPVGQVDSSRVLFELEQS